MSLPLSEDQQRALEISGGEQSFFMIGLLYEFANRLQTKGDTFFAEVSWKQCFLLICLNIMPAPPTIRDLADVVGTSHQNVKMLLTRLEKAGFVTMTADEADKRKQRVMQTEKAMIFAQQYDQPSQDFMKQLFSGIDPKQLETAVHTLLQLDENLKKM